MNLVVLSHWETQLYNKCNYYTSDSLWKIWLVESIQSIHNGLWTWHDKCNICCRYCIYHECSPQKQNGWTLRFCFWGWIMRKMYNKTIIELGFRMISWIIKTSCLCYLLKPKAEADNTDLDFDNRLFYSCRRSNLASEWQRGWSWPCFATDLAAFIVQIKLFLILAFIWEKQRGLYQSKVTSSLACIHGQVTISTTSSNNCLLFCYKVLNADLLGVYSKLDHCEQGKIIKISTVINTWACVNSVISVFKISQHQMQVLATSRSFAGYFLLSKVY